jgi:NAD(P)-dependent dehydrogenase (short-subunit alcohol dehydrogenase family)
MSIHRRFTDLSDLTGRVALVTGGGGHLGATTAEVFVELGASVAIVDVDRGRLDIVAKRLSSISKSNVACLQVDLASEEAVRTIPSNLIERFGRLDILVNCAALVGSSGLKGWSVPFAAQSVDTWRLALELNLTVPFLLSQICSEMLVAGGHGSIINVGSIYGLMGPDWSLYDDTPMGNPAAYGASKGGLSQLTRWLATTLAPAVRVNTVVPGGIARGQNAAFSSRYIKKVPLARMATEEDFKGVMGFLASDLSSYVTGQEILIDGGFCSW